MASTQQIPAGITAPTPEVVGNAFVQQYYLILHQSPELVHRFYHDSSKLGRPEEKGIMSIRTTMQGINEKILALGYGEFTAEITSVDAHDSHNGGVLVLVTGYVDDGKCESESRNPVTYNETFLAPDQMLHMLLRITLSNWKHSQKKPMGKCTILLRMGMLLMMKRKHQLPRLLMRFLMIHRWLLIPTPKLRKRQRNHMHSEGDERECHPCINPYTFSCEIFSKIS